MRGAVAAGHPLTAQAGADVLAAGGNAVDAAVGAALVSWVAESPLTGPGSGGFMLVHRARDRSTRVYDFFVAVPGLGLDNRDLSDMDRVDVDFSGGSTQVFHIGAASCAVPGAALGLEVAHRSFGSLPWRDLFRPAIELARNGVELNKGQAYLHAILDLILRHTPESREVYERNGERLVAEDTLIQKDLAATLELIAEQGGRILYEGDLADAISDTSAPTVAASRSATWRSTASSDAARSPRALRRGVPLQPAAVGGRTADRLRPADPRSARHGRARNSRSDRPPRARHARTGERAHRRRLDPRSRARTRGTRGRRLARHHPHLRRRRQGNAVALTASTGAGSGVVVPNTGIHINNMIGEFDLAKPPRAGARLSSMMSPDRRPP